MAARSSSRACKQVSVATQQARHLSILPNAPASKPRYLDVHKQPPSGIPKDLSSLRMECKKQNLPTTGSRTDLVDRLTNVALRRSRAFTTAASAHIKDKERPSSYTSATPSTIRLSTTPPPPKGVRHINTSRAMKRQNDSSTIDFAFLPTFPLPSNSIVDTSIVAASIPILPHNESPQLVQEEVDSSTPGLPQTILAVGGESTHHAAPSAMAETHDNAAAVEGSVMSNIMSGDFESAVRRTGEEVAHKAGEEVEKLQGAVGRVWSGFLDDLCGPKK